MLVFLYGSLYTRLGVISGTIKSGETIKSCETYGVKLFPLEQKMLKNIQLGVISVDTIDFADLGNLYCLIQLLNAILE